MTDTFLEHRPLLFGIAYRMLGGVAEAEDAVQEIFLRWQKQDHDRLDSARAWLIAATTRWCIDQLRSARRRREDYKGLWLPEPLLDAPAAAPGRAGALADSLSMAFMFMLEQLSPLERAVFLLREAFDFEYPEIAEIVGKSEANCRQLFSRARRTLGRRDEPVADPEPPPQAEEIVQHFLHACTTGNLGELLAVLTDDVVLYSDGGGRVPSALRPIVTADRVSRFFLGIGKRGAFHGEARLAQVNGTVGLLLRRSDGRRSVTAFALHGGRIRAIYLVNNPDKLRRVG